MKRRNFIQISSLSLAALLVKGCEPSLPFEVEYKNDMPFGHLVFESQNFQKGQKLATDYVIVGGGIAGMTAAYQLREKKFMLFEVSPMLGGTSASSNYRNIPLCHGAHYDLEYPPGYGSEVLQVLSELNIIRFDEFSKSWRFVEKKYLIPKSRESKTLAHGTFQKEVLPDGVLKKTFIKLIETYSGQMHMPSRLIDTDYHDLNNETFLEWLNRHLELSPDFIEGLDYHMKDDYGAGIDQVSALAGIHYFACRPYYKKPVELFSPPEGNAYFINKLYEQLPPANTYTSHVVKKINPNENGFELEVIDALAKEVISVECKKLIYAGNKHALKYIYPNDYSAFENNEYAPWVVVNLVVREDWQGKSFWQNEIISDDPSLMGFVDSKAQFTNNSNQRVLTVYYCFKPEEREMMSLIQERKQSFVDQTVRQVEKYLGLIIRKKIEKVFIKQMGHAMPIPKTGYLFKDANKERSNLNLVYAGVDNGRLPLMYEAMDSGIMAVEELG